MLRVRFTEIEYKTVWVAICDLGTRATARRFAIASLQCINCSDKWQR